MKPLALRVETAMHLTPEETIHDAIELAREHDRPVVFNWSGVDVLAYPNSTGESVDKERLSALETKAECDRSEHERGAEILAKRIENGRALNRLAEQRTPDSARPLIYIAGPLRAPTPWEIEQNVRRAEEYGLEIANMGGIPVIPHTMYHFYQNSLPDEFWLQADLALLRACHAIAVDVKETFARDSEGTCAEITDAQARGLPVFYNDHHIRRLPDWIETWIKEHAK